MTGTTTLRISATIDDQFGRDSSLVWRRLTAWPHWPLVAMLGGLLVIVLTYVPILWLAVMSFSQRPLSGSNLTYPCSLSHSAMP